MKLTSKRFADMKDKIRAKTIAAIIVNDDIQLARWVRRMNIAGRIQRERSLALGMPGKAWQDYTLEQVKTQYSAKYQ